MTHLKLLDFAINKPEISIPFFEKLKELEYGEENQLRHMNGGFAVATIHSIDYSDVNEPCILVSLESGYQDEFCSDIHTEIFRFDINTLEWRV